MPLNLKKDDAGVPVMKDNKFVYVDDNTQQELELDPAHLYGRVRELTGQNAAFRSQKEELEATVEKFKDLDPDKAREALQKLQDIDTKKLMDAQGVDAIRQQMRDAAKAENEAVTRAFQQQISERDGTIKSLTDHLNREMIGGQFHRSEWVQKNINVPVDMFMTTFAGNFKVEDGKLWGYMNDQKVFDPSDFQSPAKFDMVIERLVENYPFKDQILKGHGSSGSDAKGDTRPGVATKGNLGGTREERVAAVRASLPPELRGGAN